MPKERPILFQGEMVRAILAGKKTQTRRIVAPGKGVAAWRTKETIDKVRRFDKSPVENWWTMAVGEPRRIVHCGQEMDGGHIGSVRCPYGVPGDRLWVRETIRLKERWRFGETDVVTLDYAADNESTFADAWPWKRDVLPAIHCPRGLSRITLEVTSVRVERLRDISEEDARAEGVPLNIPADMCADPVAEYRELWDLINEKKAPWSSSPWVWVVSFNRVTDAALEAL